eukprot:6197954-Pleurochrysis_carterae.AAC.1
MDGWIGVFAHVCVRAGAQAARECSGQGCAREGHRASRAEMVAARPVQVARSTARRVTSGKLSPQACTANGGRATRVRTWANMCGSRGGGEKDRRARERSRTRLDERWRRVASARGRLLQVDHKQ